MARTVSIALILLLCLASCDDEDGQGPGPEPLPTGAIDPVWEYGRDLGNSVTGGYVYRGPELGDLNGKYVYADFGSGRIWALDSDGVDEPTNELLVDASWLISTFGVDGDGRLYVAQYGTGASVFGLEATYVQPAGPWTYQLVPWIPKAFDNVVDIRNVGTSKLFVVEQAGTIGVLDITGPAVPETFMDITDRVTSGGELGLLGLAFHPDRKDRLFVYYTTGSGPWTVRISRFEASPDLSFVDPATEVVLLSIPQQYANHNGGGLAFDGDGHLLVAVGDEGGAGDPNDNAQDLTDLHGKILRLDVDVEGPPFYGIPSDNPFADGANGYRPEIFAYGLRNPWRISYDAPTDRIWVGDVGQGAYEEINVIVRGGNYGWDCLEGAHPYTGPGAPSPACSDPVDMP